MLKNGNENPGRLLKILALLTSEVVILMALFFTGLITFLLLAGDILSGNNYAFDAFAFQIATSLAGNIQTKIMLIFSFLGSQFFLVPAIILLIVWFIFFQKKKWFSIKIPAVAITSLLLMMSLKLFFQRPRPLNPLLEQAAGFSFPSGHSMMSATFYGLLLYILFLHVKNTWWWILIALSLTSIIVLVGFSRIYLRVHYASDVIAGFSLGITWLILSLFILTKIEKRSVKKII